MRKITFIDTEIEPNSKAIIDIGSIHDDGTIFHSPSIKDFTAFLKESEFICGHNIINHDLKYLTAIFQQRDSSNNNIIDTLYLSPLLFRKSPIMPC